MGKPIGGPGEDGGDVRLIRSVLWYSPALPSMERCSLREGPDHRHLEGTVLTLIGAGPAEIRYAVTCDRSWRTRKCTVHVDQGDRAGRIELDADGTGSWFENGVRADEFEGITDADLGFSPCTNTLPIRRLALAIGEEVRIPVVWLRFPEFDLRSSEQVYTRIAENLYRFESGAGDFNAMIETDGLGIVTHYRDLWREIRAKGEDNQRSPTIGPADRSKPGRGSRASRGGGEGSGKIFQDDVGGERRHERKEPQ